ncbi:hypothetical protein BH20VER1_BH20VER1_15480 [soil metagenome]|nr:hypothetical protein [Chthoniobacterales bacterium]
MALGGKKASNGNRLKAEEKFDAADEKRLAAIGVAESRLSELNRIFDFILETLRGHPLPLGPCLADEPVIAVRLEHVGCRPFNRSITAVRPSS